MFAAMPVPMRVWAGIESDLDCPVTIRDGRTWLAQATGGLELRLAPSAATGLRDDVPAMELDEVWFRYGRELPDVIKGLSFKAWHGEVTCILGGNATGKTTTLSLIAGAAKPWRGTVRLDGRKLGDLPKSELFDHLLGVMPQNPQALFVSKSVRDELLDALSSTSLPKSERREALGGIVGLCRLEGLLESHPYDLSGGEQQRVALAKILLLKPTILLLDEPTKGMDAQFKLVFADILHSLAKSGVAVVMVSHDMEFCASHADRCALFFNGAIVSENAPRPFFSGNSFYTSAANRMARDILPAAVTAEDLIEALGGGLEEPGSGGSDDGGGGGDAGDAGDAGGDAGDGGVADGGGSDAGGGGGGDGRAVSPKPPQDAAGSGSGGSDANDAIDAINAIDADDKSHAASLPLEGALRQKLPRRTVAAAVMILLAVPFTIFAGMYFLEDRRYFFISVAIIIETMVPFALIFEGRKPQARELVVIAVLCAIGVAGRTVFFMLPQFKPLVAMVIIAGVSFGGETGFLVGAMSFFVSDMFFGQGPWTPWQMFAGGLIGFLAGVLLKKGLLSRRRLALCAFGGLATVLIYGGLMNPASVLTFFSEPTAPLIVSAYVQGLPFDLLHAASTVAVLAIAAKPMLEKLDRIKAKYGLVER
jgi:energy-coupling factor transport system ATP-binding protein